MHRAFKFGFLFRRGTVPGACWSACWAVAGCRSTKGENAGHCPDQGMQAGRRHGR
ncbi:hypothetical protein RAA17_01800 [Komagataeibacter rhaeticus]|nr:hypothetical protein [Komagataeibacter rhaeticus]